MTPAEQIRDFTRRHGFLPIPCPDGCGNIAHHPMTCAEAKEQGFVRYDHTPDGGVVTTFVSGASSTDDQEAT